MGINDVWGVIGEGRITSLVDLSRDFYEKHHRPLRIAVDEASWRYKNVIASQVEFIRNGQPAANPVEKAILYRTLSTLKLNIDLLFVFDGPRRPRKRGGRGGGRVDWKWTRLLKEVLRRLCVPYLEAPGEAEAECANLQRRGLVDAVWSDDSDTFMFGCELMIRTHREQKSKGAAGLQVGRKSTTVVHIHEAAKLREEHGLDSNALILFAILSGGDYEEGGLAGCGPKIAMKAVRAGLGNSLVAARTRRDCDEWALLLQSTISVSVPFGFPDMKVLEQYRNPCVTPVETMNGPCWPRFFARGIIDIDEYRLRSLLRRKFNFRTKEYIRHILPLNLVRELRLPEEVRRPYVLGDCNIQLAKRQSGVRSPSSSELEGSLVKITFLPQGISKLDLKNQPLTGEDAEDWQELWTKGEGDFDPLRRTACELPRYLVRQKLPTIFGPLGGVVDSRAIEHTAIGSSSSDQKRKKRKRLHLEIDGRGSPAEKPAQSSFKDDIEKGMTEGDGDPSCRSITAAIKNAQAIAEIFDRLLPVSSCAVTPYPSAQDIDGETNNLCRASTAESSLLESGPSDSTSMGSTVKRFRIDNDIDHPTGSLSSGHNESCVRTFWAAPRSKAASHTKQEQRRLQVPVDVSPTEVGSHTADRSTRDILSKQARDGGNSNEFRNSEVPSVMICERQEGRKNPVPLGSLLITDDEEFSSPASSDPGDLLSVLPPMDRFDQQSRQVESKHLVKEACSVLTPAREAAARRILPFDRLSNQVASRQASGSQLIEFSSSAPTKTSARIPRTCQVMDCRENGKSRSFEIIDLTAD